MCYVQPLQDRYLHMEMNVGPSQRRMEIISESLKEEYLERLCSSFNNSGIWRTIYIGELYTLYNELEIE
jgi:hypothetical protein